MAANSQFGFPGSMFISAFFCSFISACCARRFSRFSFNRSTSLTTYDRRPVGLAAVVWMTGAGAGAGWTIDILDVFRMDDCFVGSCDCGGIFSMWSPWPFWFAIVLAVRLPAQNVHNRNGFMTFAAQFSIEKRIPWIKSNSIQFKFQPITSISQWEKKETIIFRANGEKQTNKQTLLIRNRTVDANKIRVSSRRNALKNC